MKRPAGRDHRYRHCHHPGRKRRPGYRRRCWPGCCSIASGSCLSCWARCRRRCQGRTRCRLRRDQRLPGLGWARPGSCQCRRRPRHHRDQSRRCRRFRSGWRLPGRGWSPRDSCRWRPGRRRRHRRRRIRFRCRRRRCRSATDCSCRDCRDCRPSSCLSCLPRRRCRYRRRKRRPCRHRPGRPVLRCCSAGSCHRSWYWRPRCRGCHPIRRCCPRRLVCRPRRSRPCRRPFCRWGHRPPSRRLDRTRSDCRASSQYCRRRRRRCMKNQDSIRYLRRPRCTGSLRCPCFRSRRQGPPARQRQKTCVL